MPQGVLADIKVLDLTWHITGPYCTKLFSDNGAEVLKVERPGSGDPARALGPFPGDLPHPEKSGVFLHLNTGKQSITLNLKTETGRGMLLRLAAEADMIVESFSPGVMERLGLGYEVLHRTNPRAVVLSISNYGQSGPYRDYRLNEITAYALGGTMHSTGIPEREPQKLGGTIILMQLGSTAAALGMAALYGALASGEGTHLDFSMMEAQAANIDRAGMGLMMASFSNAAGQGRTRGTGRTLLPNGTYPCADGYVQLTGLQIGWWDRFLAMVDRSDLLTDPRFQTPDSMYDLDLKQWIEDEILYPWLFTHTKQEIMEKAQSVGFAATALKTMEDLFVDPHFRSRNFFTTVEHPVAGTYEYPGPVIRPLAAPGAIRRAPLLGEHNEAVYCGRLGYSRADLVLLRERGII